MHRRALLRQLAVLGIVPAAGCGEYSTEFGTPPDDSDETVTVGETFVVKNTKWVQSDGNTILIVTVNNARPDVRSGKITLSYSSGGQITRVDSEIRVEGDAIETVWLTVPIHYEDRNIQNIDFEVG